MTLRCRLFIVGFKILFFPLRFRFYQKTSENGREKRQKKKFFYPFWDKINKNVEFGLFRTNGYPFIIERFQSDQFLPLLINH